MEGVCVLWDGMMDGFLNGQKIATGFLTGSEGTDLSSGRGAVYFTEVKPRNKRKDTDIDLLRILAESLSGGDI